MDNSCFYKMKRALSSVKLYMFKGELTHHLRRCRRRALSMIHVGIITVLILILFLGNLEAVSLVSQHPDEEYFLEHEVLYEDAIMEARNLEIFTGLVPGCNVCTNSELTYCKNGSVINDHCCCEGSSNKVFLFVEHACRVGPEQCEVHAGDCGAYARLRECCCHSYLASVWKRLANSAESQSKTNSLKCLVMFAVSFFCYNRFSSIFC